MQIRSAQDVIRLSFGVSSVCLGVVLVVTYITFRENDLLRHMLIASVVCLGIAVPNTLFAGRKMLENHQLLQQLQHLLHTDVLTDLSNRRHFIAELGGEKGWHRSGALLMVDIDKLKEINDEHGHLAGDDVIRAVANALRNLCGELDHVCRFGGEEFVVFLHDRTPEGGEALAHRVREAVERTIVASRNAQVAATVSVGCAFKAKAEDVEDSLLRADMALYAAKKSGRNLVTTNWA